MAIQKLLRLEDIVLIPSVLNSGYDEVGTFNYGVTSSVDRVTSLPIFTSPNPAIVNNTNYSVFSNQGIRPVLPRILPIDTRLEACQYMFSAFSIEEVNEFFLSRGKRSSSQFFFIAFDDLNGNNCTILKTILNLKQVYNNQVIVMSAPINNPKTYIEYSKVGTDFVRVSGGCGASVDVDSYGFYYPMASMLQDTLGYKATITGTSLLPKIVADGGISSATDILKCLALGADYVMIGEQFSKLLESAGQIYEKETNGKLVEIKDPSVLTEADIHELDLYRNYNGLSSHEYQAKVQGFSTTEEYLSGDRKIYRHEDCHNNLIKIELTLNEWLSDFYNKASYAFIMSDAKNWIDYKKNIKFGEIDG